VNSKDKTVRVFAKESEELLHENILQEYSSALDKLELNLLSWRTLILLRTVRTLCSQLKNMSIKFNFQRFIKHFQRRFALKGFATSTLGYSRCSK